MEIQQYEKDHVELLRNNLAECMVLLKSNGDFPLTDTGKIALFGNGARKTQKGGTGSGEVNSRYSVNVERGLAEAGFNVVTKDWLNSYDEIFDAAKVEFKAEIKKRAKENHTNVIIEGMGAVMPEPEYRLSVSGYETDTAIYVLSRICGEGNDRRPVKGDVLLTDTEVRDILECQKTYKKFMLVLNVGGPVDLSPVVKQVKNILLLSQLGVETGAAFADVLLGLQIPSGKLTTTWAAWEDYCQEGEFGNMDDTRYKEGIYVGYRYFDTVGKKPMFPFGFGLSYTTFEHKVMSTSLSGKTVTMKVRVKNTGDKRGKEVIQLYASVPAGKLDQPYQVLMSWAKTKELNPGREETVTLSFIMPYLSSYDARVAAYVLEMGDYVLRVGNSSAETKPAAIIRIDETIFVDLVKNTLGETDFKDYVPKKKKHVEEDLSDVPVFTLIDKDITTEVVYYKKKFKPLKEVASLSDDDLIKMNIGHYEEGFSMAGIIGNSAKTVAGAAGETAHVKDFPVCVMADGPAGLRLSEMYFEDAKGKHTVGMSLPSFAEDFMPEVVKIGAKILMPSPKRDSQIKYQYCTAIPIGTALAQSFNTRFVEICGDIVGREMEIFGIHFWLAPGMNIHRSILCGRNFEYYSEDPILTGIIAGAMVKGVQRHKNCACTVKHFAANSQETNRYANSSMVSERAMREIYLKAFKICVKKSQPRAVMTSYNLINGKHTSEHRGLIEDILRTEFGFKGIVMTDWLVGGDFLTKNSRYPAPEAYKVALAGNDLMMPGSKKDFENIKEALKKGYIKREDLERNATRVYRMIKQLNESRDKE